MKINKQADMEVVIRTFKQDLLSESFWADQYFVKMVCPYHSNGMGMRFYPYGHAISFVR